MASIHAEHSHTMEDEFISLENLEEQSYVNKQHPSGIERSMSQKSSPQPNNNQQLQSPPSLNDSPSTGVHQSSNQHSQHGMGDSSSLHHGNQTDYLPDGGYPGEQNYQNHPGYPGTRGPSMYSNQMGNNQAAPSTPIIQSSGHFNYNETRQADYNARQSPPKQQHSSLHSRNQTMNAESQPLTQDVLSMPEQQSSTEPHYPSPRLPPHQQQQQQQHQQQLQQTYDSQYSWQTHPEQSGHLQYQQQPVQQSSGWTQPTDLSWQPPAVQQMPNHSFPPHQTMTDQHYPSQHYPQHYPQPNYAPQMYDHQQYPYQPAPPVQQQYHQLMPSYSQTTQQSSQMIPTMTQQTDSHKLPTPQTQQQTPMPITTATVPQQSKQGNGGNAFQNLLDCVKKSEEKFEKPGGEKKTNAKAEKPEKQTKAKAGEGAAAARGKGTKRKASVDKEVVKTEPANEGSDDESSSKLLKGLRRKQFERKNIRDIIAEDELEATTVAAQKEEQERKRRLQEAQQRALVEKFNQVIQEAEQETAAKIAADVAIKAEKAATEAAAKLAAEEAAKMASFKPVMSPLLANLKKDSDIILVDSDDDDKRKRIIQVFPKNIVKANIADINKQKVITVYPKNVVKMSPVITVSSSEEDSDSSSSSDSSSDEDEEETVLDRSIKVAKDDDCVMVLSDEDTDDEGGVNEDPNNSGSHTNDDFNQPDPEGRVLINVGHPPEEEDLFLAPQLARAVKPHQIGGIRFLYDNVVESITRFPTSSGFGCILAHSMGLGKTIQVISLTDIFLRKTTARTVLGIVPINTIQNWMSEFNMWLPPEGAVPQLLVDSNEIRPRNFPVYLLNENYRTTPTRAKIINEWNSTGGVMLMGYELYRMLALKKPAKVAKRRKNRKKEDPLADAEDETIETKHLDEIYLALVNPGPDLVVCDEGHRIKNCSASTSAALKKIHTKRRVVLTGYPLQNNLLEYWCMVDFVRPNYLGSRSEFVNMFERPIQNGQCIDSTPRDRQLMRYRAHVLHSLLEGFVQRRGHAVLRTSLPLKEEHVVLVRMTPVQRKLYREFVRDFHTRSNSTNPLLFFAVCCKIWNHPDVLYNFVKNLKSTPGLLPENDLDIDLLNPTLATTDKTLMKGNNMLMGLPNQLPENSEKSNDASIPASPSSVPNIVNGGTQIANYDTQLSLPSPAIESIVATPVKEVKEKPEPAISYDWAKILMEHYKPGVIGNCHKMAMLFTIIEQSLGIGDKLLVFSQSLLTLDLIERFLSERQLPQRPNIPLGERWIRNVNYCRLDGKTHAQERERLINNFNNNHCMYLFLLSTRAGCLGINLIGANRIVVYDASWNPCHDAQAVCRIYRYGQQKQCYIYRLVTDNCLEKKVYDRQINKQGMSDRVVDELNPESNFTWKEVSTLVSESEDDGPEQDFTDKVSKYTDHLLQFMCTNMSNALSREPFEHESLLLDRKELKLTKQEKKIAKQSYELEKRGNASGYGRGYTYTRGGIMQRGAYQGSRGPTQFATPTGVQGPRFLPNQSTPVPNQWNRNQGKNNNATILIRAMLHQGVMVRRVTPSNGDSSTVTIPAGQEVLVMRTPKGVYLRVPDGRIIAVRLPQELLNQWQAIGTTTTIGLGGPPTPRPNLLRTSMMTSTTNTTTTTSSAKGNFGTQIVQANLQCGGSVKVASNTIDGNPEIIDLSDDEEKQRANAAVDAALKSGCSTIANTTMTTTTVSAGAINRIRPMPRIIKVPIPQQELKKATPGGGGVQPARIIIRQVQRHPGNINVSNSNQQTVTFTRQSTQGGAPSITITRVPQTTTTTGLTETQTTGSTGKMLQDSEQSTLLPRANIKKGEPQNVTIVRQPFVGNLKGQPRTALPPPSPSGGQNAKSTCSDTNIDGKNENSALGTHGSEQISSNLQSLEVNANESQEMSSGALQQIESNFGEPTPMTTTTGQGSKQFLEECLPPGHSLLQKDNIETMSSLNQKMQQIPSHSAVPSPTSSSSASSTVMPRNNHVGFMPLQSVNPKGRPPRGRKTTNNRMLTSRAIEDRMMARENQMNLNTTPPSNMMSPNDVSGQQNHIGPEHMQFNNPIGQNPTNNHQNMDSFNKSNQLSIGNLDHHQHHHHHHHQQQQQQHHQQQQQQQAHLMSHSQIDHASTLQTTKRNSKNCNRNTGLQSMENELPSLQLPSPAGQQNHSHSGNMISTQQPHIGYESPRQSPSTHLTLLGEPQQNTGGSRARNRSTNEKQNQPQTDSAPPPPPAPPTGGNSSYSYNSSSLPSDSQIGYSGLDPLPPNPTSMRPYGDDPYRQHSMNEPLPAPAPPSSSSSSSLGFPHDRPFGMYEQNYYPTPSDPLGRNESAYPSYGSSLAISNQGYSSFPSMHFGEQPAHMPNYYDPSNAAAGALSSFGHYSTPHTLHSLDQRSPAGFNYSPYGHSPAPPGPLPPASNQNVANHHSSFLPNFDSFSGATSPTPKYGTSTSPVNANSTSNRQSPFSSVQFSSRHHFLSPPPPPSEGNTPPGSQIIPQGYNYHPNQMPYSSTSSQPLQNMYNPPIP